MAIRTDLIERDEKKQIYLNPKLISTYYQLDKVQAAIDNFSEKYNCEAVVAVTDNRQLGTCYFITSKKIATKEIKNKKQPERWIEFYTRSDYEKLRDKIKD